jgi:glycosyltransferase involved in cell wall biosynthesis
MNDILIIGPSPNTRGGISEVVKSYKQSHLWKSFKIIWIGSYDDRSIVHKIWFIIHGFLEYCLMIPNTKLVHIHLSEPYSAIRKSIYFLLAKLFGKKIIIHFHGFDVHSSIRGKYSTIYRHLFNNADIVIVLSPYWYSVIRKYIPLASVTILYNPSISAPGLNLPKKNHILFSGTLNKRKGYSILIKAFAKIALKYPKWSIVLAGNGEIEKAQDLANELSISSQVHMLGWISGEEKVSVLSQSKIFCLPSYAEGFPMAIIEALSYKIPVISTRCGRIDLVLQNGEHILYFDMGDVDQLANIMEKLMKDKELRSNIGLNGHNYAEKYFKLDVVINQLSDIYVRLLNE